MKTSPGNSKKAGFGRAILLVALAIMLGSTGCQKDDELLPSDAKLITESGANATKTDLNIDESYFDLDKYTAVENDILINRSLPTIDESATVTNNSNFAATLLFNMIRFDHQAGTSKLPDYTVIVRSDGLVMYDGHRNVRVLGRVNFMISDITIPVIHEIFRAYSFYSIVPDFKVYADQPVVFTTYRPDRITKQKTIYDDYDKNPEKLILIRTSVEKLLGIDRYVKEWNNIPSEDQQPLF